MAYVLFGAPASRCPAQLLDGRRPLLRAAAPRSPCLPWVRRRLAALDTSALRARLSLALAIATSLALILATAVVTAQEEQLAEEQVRATQEIEAQSVAQNVSDYIEMNGARAATLAAFAGRAPMTAEAPGRGARELAAGSTRSWSRSGRWPPTAGWWRPPAARRCRCRPCRTSPRRSARHRRRSSSLRSGRRRSRCSCWARRSMDVATIRRNAGGGLRRPRRWSGRISRQGSLVSRGATAPAGRSPRSTRCGRRRGCPPLPAGWDRPDPRRRAAGRSREGGGLRPRLRGSAGWWPWSARGPTPWPACAGGATSPSACSCW